MLLQAQSLSGNEVINTYRHRSIINVLTKMLLVDINLSNIPDSYMVQSRYRWAASHTLVSCVIKAWSHWPIAFVIV